MIQIREYLTTKVSKSKIKATDETIKQIIKEQLDKYGHDCDLNHVDVSKVTDMSSLFSCYTSDLGESYSDLNPDISEWDVSNVTDMYAMFYNCQKFNSSISNWNIENVRFLDFMFYNCKSFDQDLSKWNTKSATAVDKPKTFFNCPLRTKPKYCPKFA